MIKEHIAKIKIIYSSWGSERNCLIRKKQCNALWSIPFVACQTLISNYRWSYSEQLQIKIKILSTFHLQEFIRYYTLIQMNYTQCAKLITYFVTFVWDSRHGVVCVANMVRDGEVAMKRHHVFVVYTSEVHHLVMLSLTQ